MVSATKAFYLNFKAEGYVRSEGVAAAYIQRRSMAKRIYATIIHVKSNNDGYKEAGVNDLEIFMIICFAFML